MGQRALPLTGVTGNSGRRHGGFQLFDGAEDDVPFENRHPIDSRVLHLLPVKRVPAMNPVRGASG